MLTQAQLEMRRTGIGSSDIGAIVGASPYRTIHDVWLDKRGLVEQAPDSLPVRVGNLVEELIATLYIEETGNALTRGETLRHPERDWIVATPDRWVDGSKVLVEIKWVGWRVAAQWGRDEDAVPPYVRTQIEWQMLTTGAKECHVAALIGGEEFRIYRIESHDALASRLIELADRFWRDHVLSGVAPPVDASESARRMLEAIYRQYQPQLKMAPPIAEDIAAQYLDAKEREKAADRDATEAANKLCEIIGDADGIEGAWGKATWRRSKGHERRTLRVTSRKDKAA